MGRTGGERSIFRFHLLAVVAIFLLVSELVVRAFLTLVYLIQTTSTFCYPFVLEVKNVVVGEIDAHAFRPPPIYEVTKRKSPYAPLRTLV